MTLPPTGDPPPHALPDGGPFLLLACQPGAEPALAARMLAAVPGSRRAAWRPGVVTFRLPAGQEPDDALVLGLHFATAAISCRGQAVGSTSAELVAHALTRAGPPAWRNVHVWKRDARIPGDIEPLRVALLAGSGLSADLPAVADPGTPVLDVVIDSETRWWVGRHVAHAPASCWPGGRYPRDLPEGKVSRAWLKLDEAIASFSIPFVPGQRACELGAAPGGSCLRLLEAGLSVVGIDPALIDEQVAAHPRFAHWRMRSRDARLQAFRGFDWIVSDMNIDPEHSLEAIGRVVKAAGVRPRGIVATLKLPRWSQAASLPEWLEVIRSWGFDPRCRQLSTGGREVCVVALAARGRRSITSRPRRATPRRGR